MNHTPFDVAFQNELYIKAHQHCKLEGVELLITVAPLPDSDFRSRRMMNKAPILNNFLSEIQGDIDLTRAYTNGNITCYELVLYDYHYEGKIAVVRYNKHYTVSH